MNSVNNPQKYAVNIQSQFYGIYLQNCFMRVSPHSSEQLIVIQYNHQFISPIIQCNHQANYPLYLGGLCGGLRHLGMSDAIHGAKYSY